MNRKQRRTEKAKTEKPAIEQRDYSKLRVLIAVPSNDMVHADFAMSLASICAHNTSVRLRTALNNYKSADIAKSRNQQVIEAQRLKATHILFVDSDMLFPAWAVQRLVDASIDHKQDIVGVTVPKRVHPFHQVAKDQDGNRFKIDFIEERNLVEASDMGTGMVLINMKVFEKVGFPYFESYYKDGKDGKPDPMERVGEDQYFFIKAREEGYKTMIDIPLSKDTGHIGQVKFDYTSEDFFADATASRKERADARVKEKQDELQKQIDEHCEELKKANEEAGKAAPKALEEPKEPKKED